MEDSPEQRMCEVLIPAAKTKPPINEKVYCVSETPAQHTCGVSKTNENLTNVLKITTHQRLYKK